MLPGEVVKAVIGNRACDTQDDEGETEAEGDIFKDVFEFHGVTG
jgi:hypothetical protein